MPISSSAAVSVEKRKAFRVQNKTEVAVETQENVAGDKDFLTIGPALPPPQTTKKLYKRSHSTLTTTITTTNACGGIKKDGTGVENLTTLHPYQNGTLVSRTQKEKERQPDRISLDRRGLTTLPFIEDEPKLRLLSLQHNLINNLTGLREQHFPFLVFLDVYDNQLERICCLDKLENLRVLLIGKNRIKKIEGLQNSSKIEVLDLHGNQIQGVSGLSSLSELKVLNLAGNQLKAVGARDFEGLTCLQELNLRRNRIRKVLGFGETPNLQKLFLSNNELLTINDMSSVAKSSNLKEISIENNPVFLSGDCVSFLVSYLPFLHTLNAMQVTEQVRKAAMAWRRNKESTNSAFMDLASDVNLTGRREEVISNARTNWELLRSQTKCLTAITTSCGGSIPKVAKPQPDADFILTSLEAKSKLKQNTKVPPLTVKKTCVRTTSQDTDNSSSNSSELFRLPPILVPIINKMGQTGDGAASKETFGSLSSIGPNVDSSVSSLNSSEHSDVSSSSSSVECDSEEEEEEEEEREEEGEGKDVLDVPKPEDVAGAKKSEVSCAESEKPSVNSNTSGSDTASNLSTASTATIPNSSSETSSKNSSKSSRSVRSAANLRSVQAKVISRALTAKPKKQSSPNAQGNATGGNRDREQGGDYLIEICGRHLNVYGQGALRFVDKPWSHSKANDVYTINFNYANFNGITAVLGKVKQRFPNAENFVFKETNIQHLGQLNALAEIQGLTSLHIGDEGNPVATKKWKPYAVFRLSHWGLRVINGAEVTEEDVKAANEEYQSLSDLVLWSLPDVLLQPLLVRLRIDVGQTESNEHGAKRWLLNADPALKSVVSKEALQWKKGSLPQEDLAARQKAKNYIGCCIIDRMCHAVNKLRLLDEKWAVILHEMVRNTLLDYSQLDMYMKEKIQELK